MPVKVSSFKLLTPTTGWASTGKALIWTTDNGAHWKTISPPDPHLSPYGSDSGIADVFFLDDQTGWVLLSYNASTDEDDDVQWAFDLAHTTDGGNTWSTVPVDATNLPTDRLNGNGTMSFSNSLNGWVNLGIQSGSAFSTGVLLRTTDAGKTWSSIPGDPALSGPVLLQQSGNGWIVHDSADNLYATLDGGKTFQEIVLPPPGDVATAVDPTETVYNLPVFDDNLQGHETVLYTNTAGSKAAVVVFSTSDGGQSWTPDSELANVGLSSFGTLANTAVANSTLIVPIATAGNSPTLMRVGKATTAKYANTAPNEIRASSFVTPMQGWIACKSGLYSTTDGGSTWYKISPTFAFGGAIGSSYRGVAEDFTKPASANPLPSVPAPSSSYLPTTSLAVAVPVASGISQRLGFDRSQLPTIAQMQDWWNNSPYYVHGFYLNGGASHPNQRALTADWVSSVSQMGWGLVPIWSGLQAPCACWKHAELGYPACTTFPHTFSSDPAAATIQGAGEADQAYLSALSLNLDGGVIYIDMEQFSSPACGAAAQAFLSGWVQEMNINSGPGSGGVYGSVSNGASDLAAASPAPSNAFLARYNKAFTVWHFQHGLADSVWGNHQRIGQIWRNGTKNPQHWGSTSMSIDTDVVDGLVYPSTASKDHSFTEADVEYPGAYSSEFNGMNNDFSFPNVTQTAVGTYIESSTFNYYGTIYSGGSFASNRLQYNSDPNVYLTQPWAINNSSQIVGYYYYNWPDNDIGHGFLYDSKKGTYTTIDYPGAMYTYPTGINDAGWIVGTYADASYRDHCFIRKGTTFTTFDPSGGYQGCWGINGSGQIVGTNDSGGSGFIDDIQSGSPASGSVTSISIPGTSGNGVQYTSINNNGLVVAYDYGQQNSYLLNDANWNSLLSAWGEAYGINDNAQITGWSSATPFPPDGDGFILSPQR